MKWVMFQPPLRYQDITTQFHHSVAPSQNLTKKHVNFPLRLKKILRAKPTVKGKARDHESLHAKACNLLQSTSLAANVKNIRGNACKSRNMVEVHASNVSA